MYWYNSKGDAALRLGRYMYTTGLAEINSSLPPGLWAARHRDQLRAVRSTYEHEIAFNL